MFRTIHQIGRDDVLARVFPITILVEINPGIQSARPMSQDVQHRLLTGDQRVQAADTVLVVDTVVIITLGHVRGLAIVIRIYGAAEERFFREVVPQRHMAGAARVFLWESGMKDPPIHPAHHRSRVGG